MKKIILLSFCITLLQLFLNSNLQAQCDTITAIGPICSGTSMLEFELDGCPGGSSYTWTIDDIDLTGTVISNPGTSSTIDLDIGTMPGTFELTCLSIKAMDTTTVVDTFLILELPDVNAGMDTIVCEGGLIILHGESSSTITTWEWTNDGSYSETGQLNTISGVQTDDAGDYYLEVTDDMGCVNNDTINVLVDTLPIAIIVDETANACGSVPYLITGASASYGIITWDDGAANGTFDNNSLIDPTYTFGISDYGTDVTLTMFVTGEGACSMESASDNIVISVGEPPIIVADGPLVTEICENDTGVSITGLTVTGGGNPSWEVTTGSGTFNDDEVLVPEFTPSDENDVVLTLTVEGTNGCPDATYDYMIDNQALPTANISSTMDDVCGSETYQIMGASASNGVIVWEDNEFEGSFDDNSIIDPTYTFAPNDYGDIHDLTLIVSGINGCAGEFTSDDISITVANPPTLSGNGADVICSNETSTVTGVSGMNGTFSWMENGAGSITSGGSTLTPTYTPAAGDVGTTVTLTLTVMGQNSCMGTDVTGSGSDGIFHILVEDVPIGTNSTDAICSGTSTNIDLQSLISNSLASDFTWTVTANPNVTGESSGAGDVIVQTLTNTSNSNQSIVYTIIPESEEGECEGDPFDVTVTIYESVVFVLSSNDSACPGMNNGSYDIVVNSGNGPYTYDDGTNNGSFAGSLTSPNISSGLYNVTVADEFNCTNDASVTVDESPVPDPLITGVNTICITGNGSTELTVISTSGMDTDDWTYDWSPGNGSTNPLTVTNGGNYTVEVTNMDGCMGTSPVFEVTENTELTFEITPDPSNGEICLGQSIELCGPMGMGSNFEYEWDTGETIRCISKAPNNPGISTHTLLVTDTSPGGCSGEESIDIVVHDLPTAMVSVENNGEYCEEEAIPTITFTLTGEQPFNFQYNSPNGPINVNNHNQLTYLISNPNEGDYSLHSLEDGNGCSLSSLSDTITIIEHPLPNVTISGATGVCEGLETSFSVPQENNNIYNWEGPNGQTSNTETIMINDADPNSDSGVYNVIVTSENGCEDENSIILTVTDKPTITISGGGIYCSNDDPPNIIIEMEGTPPFNFEYTDDNGNDEVESSNSSTYIIDNPAEGTYSITDFEDASCEGDLPLNQVSVDEIPSPEPQINPSQDKICVGGTIMLNSTLSVGEHSWAGPGIVGSASENSATINAPGLYTLTVVLNNCPGIATIEIEESIIEATIGLDDQEDEDGICLGTSVEMEAFGNSLDNITEYVWGPPFDNNDKVNTDTPSSMGTSNYSVTVTNEYGCEDEEAISVMVHDPKIPTFDVSNFMNCEGEDINIEITNPEFDNISWSVIGDQGENDITFDAEENIISVDLQTIDANGCIEIVTIGTFETYQTPTVQTIEEINVKENQSFTIKATDLNIDNACAGNVKYNWYVEKNGSDPVLLESNVNDPILNSQADGMEGDIWVISLIIEDDCMCSSVENQTTLYILSNDACDGFINNLNGNSGCVGDIKSFTGKSSPGNGNIFQEVFWTVDDVLVTQGDENGNWEIIDFELDGGDGSIQILFKKAGQYIVRWHYDYGTCVGSSKSTVNIEENPSIAPNGLPDPLCYGSDLVIPFDGFPDGNFNYTMTYNAGNGNQTYTFSKNIQEFIIGNVTEDFTINFVMVENFNTKCNSLIELGPIEVDVLDQFDVPISFECSDDLDSISYIFDFEGGLPPYTISYKNGNSEEIEKVVLDSFMTPLDKNQAYTFTLTSECGEDEKITLNEECITCPELSNEFNTQIKTYPNTQVCSNEPTNISFSDLDFDPTVFTVVPVLQENNADIKYADSTVLFQFDNEIDHPGSSSQGFPIQNFNFDIDFDVIKDEYPGLEFDKTYALTFYVLPKTSNGFREENCIGERVNVRFVQAPEPEIQSSEPDLIVCKNQIDVILSVEEYTVNWDLLSTFDGDMTQYGTNDLYLGFENVDFGESVLVETTASENGCSNKDTIEIQVSSDPADIAPPKDTVFVWPGGIFVYNNQDEDLCYSWGKENGPALINENGRVLIDEDADLVNNVYWVDVSYKNGDDCNECVNRVYVNALGPPKLTYKPNEDLEILILPNPAIDFVNLTLNGLQGGMFDVRILSISGKSLDQFSILKETIKQNNEIDLSSYPSGVYFIQIFDEGGKVYVDKLIKI